MPPDPGTSPRPAAAHPGDAGPQGAGPDGTGLDGNLADRVRHDPLLAGLRAVSGRIGADRSLVQGGGGNTSLKADGVLWIKASGRWLARAADEPMFVPLDLAAVRAGIAADDPEAPHRAVLSARCPPGLRASIETSLHALMPQAVVLHAHVVSAIGWLVCEGGADEVARRMAGLRWVRVPYERPGLPLTREVARALATQEADVVLLDNHGVVVGGADVAAAEALLQEVDRRFAATGAPAVAQDGNAGPDRALAEGLRGTAYRLPVDPACHALARDAGARRFATGGAAYPDHVVFLGGGLPVVDPADDADWPARLGGSGAPAVLVAGLGVAVHERLDAGGEAMLRCLIDVARALPPGGVVRYLPDAEVQGLQNWDAEKFRRAQV
jgi:rhamnose utilization protein RhaD (predicted bifunctional aldolase and dehydrogenase)